MPTIPRYPPQGIPRCPVCDQPFQTCTGHEGDPVYDSSPKYLIGVRLPRAVPVPIRGARTQAYQYPPHVKGVPMAEQRDETTAVPERTGGVSRKYPPDPAPGSGKGTTDAPPQEVAETPTQEEPTAQEAPPTTAPPRKRSAA